MKDAGNGGGDVTSSAEHLNIADRPPTTPGLVAAYLLGFISLVMLIIGVAIEAPIWVSTVAIVGLALGGCVMGYLAAREAVARKKAIGRVIAATAWAPVRFVLDWTF